MNSTALTESPTLSQCWANRKVAQSRVLGGSGSGSGEEMGRREGEEGKKREGKGGREGRGRKGGR